MSSALAAVAQSAVAAEASRTFFMCFLPVGTYVLIWILCPELETRSGDPEKEEVKRPRVYKVFTAGRIAEAGCWIKFGAKRRRRGRTGCAV